MIRFKEKGDFSRTIRFLKKEKQASDPMPILEKYAQEGVNALMNSTPVDTGVTASSWYYTIDRKENSYSLNFCNSNIQNGVSIAIILQYGHGTGTGGFVQGIDYINPALSPIFEKIAEDAWKEVTNI